MIFVLSQFEIYNKNNKRKRLQHFNLNLPKEALPMSQLAREFKVKDLLEKQKFNQKEISAMTDPQIEYYHWLYFEDSCYDYM